MAEDDIAAGPGDQSEDATARSPAADLALSGLVGARLCHDLVGPVGAITNGLDLMADAASSGAGSAEDLALVAQSTDRAADLLRALRLAFGQTTSGGQPVPRERLVGDLRKVVTTRRVHLAALGAEGQPLPGEVAQLAALLILSGRLVVGISGTMQLVFSQNAALPLRLTAEGPKAGLSAPMRAWLSATAGEMPSSREVEFALLPRVAAAIGARIDWEDDGEGRVVLTVRPA